MRCHILHAASEWIRLLILGESSPPVPFRKVEKSIQGLLRITCRAFAINRLIEKQADWIRSIWLSQALDVCSIHKSQQTHTLHACGSRPECMGVLASIQLTHQGRWAEFVFLDGPGCFRAVIERAFLSSSVFFCLEVNLLIQLKKTAYAV